MYFIEIETGRKSTATHQRPDGKYVRVVGHRDPEGLTSRGSVMAYPSVQALEQDLGYQPKEEYDDAEMTDEMEEHIRETVPIWRYWITTPDEYLGGVKSGGIKDFVAAAGGGSLPPDWTEKSAEDDLRVAHTVCSFTLTLDGARALGSEQRFLQTFGSTPSDVHFFQRVADIQGFSGIERVSRQPTKTPSQLYAPTELYQTSHPDAADARGGGFDKSDVLSVTGLTLA